MNQCRISDTKTGTITLPDVAITPLCGFQNLARGLQNLYPQFESGCRLEIAVLKN